MYPIAVILLVFFVTYLFAILSLGFLFHFSWQAFAGNVAIPESFRTYELEDVTIPVEGKVSISAWFLRSPSNRDGKAIILVHGFNVTRLSLLDEAHFFLESGFHVLLYDQRSHGNSSFARCSFGRYESDDFATALRFMQAHPLVDNTQIMALGASSGASSIMYAMSDESIAGSLRALIFEGAWSRTHAIPQHFMSQRMRLPFLIRYWIHLFVLIPAGYIFWNGQAPHASPVDVASHLAHLPVLLIWGKRDIVVPSSAMEELYHAVNAPKEVWWIEDGGHDLAIRYYPQQYRQRVTHFIKQHFNLTKTDVDRLGIKLS